MTEPTRERREAFARAQAFADPVGEARRRWSTYRTSVKQVEEIRDGLPKPFTLVESRWEIAGQPHGLRDLLPPNAPSSDVEDAEQRIAAHALFNDELRKGK